MKKKPRRLATDNVGVDDTSTRHALRISEAQATRAVRNQGGIRRLRGSVAWKGNLEESRLGRSTKVTRRPS
jgi:hypothetical protein